ncbi:MAG: hypothetical protein KDB22_09330 [Planctomycetales bacterium]|nr:hypothetical protein [Planctomycetales bacterium]
MLVLTYDEIVNYASLNEPLNSFRRPAMNPPSQPSTDALRTELLEGLGKLSIEAVRLYRWRAAALWLSGTGALAVALLLVDISARHEITGLRFLACIALLLVSGWLGSRFLVPAWKQPPSLLEFAKWIERFSPDQCHGLTSAVELAQLSPTDQRYGSVAFREAYLQEWGSTHNLPAWQSYVDKRRWWRSLTLMLVVFTFLISLAAVRPAETRTALLRLMMPWSDRPWPRADVLQFVNLPTAAAIGAELQIEIIDARPPLPADVDLQIQFVDRDGRGDDRTEVRTIRTKIVGELAIANLPKLDRSVSLRAIGGDDYAMPWQSIQVVPPPDISQYKFQVEPPDYSRRQSFILVGRRITVLSGSRVELTGQFDEPLKSIRMILSGTLSTSQQVVADVWQCHLAADKMSFRLGSDAADGGQLRESANWFFEVTTETGINVRLPDLWSVTVQDDAPPSITLRPLEMELAASNATIPLVGTATDDLGLAEVKAYLKNDTTSETRVSELLFLDSARLPPTELAIDDFVSVDQLSDVQNGHPLTLWLEAIDSRGQSSKSQVHQLVIRSPQEIAASLRLRLAQLLAQLRSLIEAQRNNQQLTHRLAVRLAAEEPQPQDADALATAEQIQISIFRQLSSDDEASFLAQLRASQSQLLRNQLELSDLGRELALLASRTEQLTAAEMQTALTLTTEAAQAARRLRAGTVSAEQLGSLADAAAAAQDTALTALLQILDLLSKEESWQQLKSELAGLLNQQRLLQSETDSLQLESLATREQARIEVQMDQLRASQLELARQLDNLTHRAQTAEADDSSVTGEQFGKAVQSLSDAQTSQKMREAAQQLGAERFSMAVMMQQDVVSSLEEALLQLGQTGVASAARSLESHASRTLAASQNLSQIAEQQAELAEQMDALGQAADSMLDRSWRQLLKAQAELRERTASEAESLEASAAAEASNALSQAIELQERISHVDASQINSAVDDAAAAAALLESAARRLSARAERIEREAQMQLVFQLAADLDRLAALQAGIVDHLSQPDDVIQHNFEAASIATEQDRIRQGVQLARENSGPLPTFQWMLQQIEQHMARSAAAVRKMRIQPEALQSASDALRKLQLTSAALAAVADEAKQKDPSSEEQGSAENDSDARRVPPLAGLRLIRALQEDLLQQTRKVNELADDRLRMARLGELVGEQEALEKQLQQLQEFMAE